MTIRSFSYTTDVGAPPGLPGASQILGRVAGENFPVASVVLPRECRHHLLAFYGFARLVDYLGDEYTGIYPRTSPGGWQIIGHTDAVMWDPDRDPAALLRPGDQVRFVNVMP